MPLTVLTRQKQFDIDRNNNKPKPRNAALNIPQERYQQGYEDSAIINITDRNKQYDN